MTGSETDMGAVKNNNRSMRHHRFSMPNLGANAKVIRRTSLAVTMEEAVGDDSAEEKGRWRRTSLMSVLSVATIDANMEKKLGSKFMAWFRPFISFVFCALESALMTVATGVIKTLPNIPLATMTFVRFMVICILALPIVIYRRQGLLPMNRMGILIVVRAVFLAVSSFLGFFAIKHMRLGDAAALSTSSTVFVCIYARFILKEPIDRMNVVNIFLVIIAIILISKPSFIFGPDDSSAYEDDPLAPYALGLLIFSSAVALPAVFLILRATKDIHYSVQLTTANFITACIMLLTGLVIGYVEEGKFVIYDLFSPWTVPEWLGMVGLGVIGFLGQFLLTTAFRFETAATVSTMKKALDIFYSFLSQILIFQEDAPVTSIIGASLIILAVFLIGVKRILEDKLPKNHPLKVKYLAFIFGPVDNNDDADPAAWDRRRRSIMSEVNIELPASRSRSGSRA